MPVAVRPAADVPSASVECMRCDYGAAARIIRVRRRSVPRRTTNSVQRRATLSFSARTLMLDLLTPCSCFIIVSGWGWSSPSNASSADDSCCCNTAIPPRTWSASCQRKTAGCQALQTQLRVTVSRSDVISPDLRLISFAVFPITFYPRGAVAAQAVRHTQVRA